MRGRPSGLSRQTAAACLAFWGLTGLAVLSVVIRPVAQLVRLPLTITNIDAALVPVVASVVVVVVGATWRSQPKSIRVATGTILILGLCVLLSWALGDTTTWAGIALGFASVVLFPLTLYLAAVGMASARRRAALIVLRLVVMMQLFFGLWQYVAYDVAARAPVAADFVDGTTSHNFWPVFALPASLVLVVVDKGRHKLIWPAAVALLATYAEAKAALIVWVPAIALVLAVIALQRARDYRGRSLDLSVDRATGWALVAIFVGVVIGGLWWTPSVQGTATVFLGHSRDLGNFVENRGQVKTAPTLREAAVVLGDAVPATASSFLLGLGPGNSVSHAAEVLAQGARSGVALPSPGPVASRMFTGPTQLTFEDAQSSLLGLWGDLGTLGSLAYLVATGACIRVLLTPAWGKRPYSWPRLLTACLLVAGTLAAGLLLGWPEQASVVLPLTLAILVVAKVQSTPTTLAQGKNVIPMELTR